MSLKLVISQIRDNPTSSWQEAASDRPSDIPTEPGTAKNGRCLSPTNKPHRGKQKFGTPFRKEARRAGKDIGRNHPERLRMGLRDQNRDRDLGERPQRGSDTPDFQAQRRTGLHAAVPARRLQALESHEGTPLGAFRLRAHRLPGHHLLRRAQKRARESPGQHRP